MLICPHGLNKQADLRPAIMTFNSYNTPASPSAKTIVFIDSRVDNAAELMAIHETIKLGEFKSIAAPAKFATSKNAKILSLQYTRLRAHAAPELNPLK